MQQHKQIERQVALELLRIFLRSIPQETAALGINPEEVGLHSLRSSAAMAMYLNGVPICTIMLIGRWSSDAFLRYIRPQVMEFGMDVSQRMISNTRFYHHVDPSREDPRNSASLHGSNHRNGNYRGAISESGFTVWDTNHISG